MSTYAQIDARRVKLSIAEKARLLFVWALEEPGRLAVTSGSRENTAYVVRFVPKDHGAAVTHYCPCDARGYCSHRQAADWYLEAQHRAFYCEVFNIYA